MRIIGIAGWSGSGKTTLLTRVIPRLVARGLKVSTLKHAHHKFDIDTPGKDSYSHREAGATEVLVASANRYALMHELRGAPEPSVAELLAKLSPADLVIVEGWKVAHYAKIEVYRQEVGKPPLHPDDPYILGIASDMPLPDAGRRVVALSDLEAVVALMLEKSELMTTVMTRLASPSPALVGT
jgi:molybdopterin-guanine dinucleotide biosynthesis adapter protein